MAVSGERNTTRALRGPLAAAVTPFTAAGAVDEAVLPVYLDFLAGAGLTGILALGTTGEGALMSVQERQHAATLFRGAAGTLSLAVNCGAVTTRDTALLAGHAAEIGADAVVVMGPPYYALDEDELFGHFREAALACTPLPFYLYEFAARTGYSIPPPVVERLRDAVPNIRGMKVSDRDWDDVRRYMLPGLDVFVGSEPLIAQAMGLGAAGAISGVAAGFPELVARTVSTGDAVEQSQVTSARSLLNRFPFQAALKTVLRLRGVPVGDHVRAPLRSLTEQESETLLAEIALRRLATTLTVDEARRLRGSGWHGDLDEMRQGRTDAG